VKSISIFSIHDQNVISSKKKHEIENVVCHMSKKVEEDTLPAVFFKSHLPLCHSFTVTDIESKNGSLTANEWGGSPGGGFAYT